jgi:hypothetical protein
MEQLSIDFRKVLVKEFLILLGRSILHAVMRGIKLFLENEETFLKMIAEEGRTKALNLLN